MYPAGRLNRRITIQHIVGNTPDEVGEPADEWATLPNERGQGDRLPRVHGSVHDSS